jgi:hypothetical protein
VQDPPKALPLDRADGKVGGKCDGMSKKILDSKQRTLHVCHRETIIRVNLKTWGNKEGLLFSLTTIPKDQTRPSLKTDDHDQPSKSSTIIKSMIHPTSWKKRPRPSECPDLPQKVYKVLLSFEKASQKGMMWYDGK